MRDPQESRHVRLRGHRDRKWIIPPVANITSSLRDLRARSRRLMLFLLLYNNNAHDLRKFMLAQIILIQPSSFLFLAIYSFCIFFF